MDYTHTIEIYIKQSRNNLARYTRKCRYNESSSQFTHSNDKTAFLNTTLGEE